MSRIDITAGGRTVTVQHDGDLKELGAEAERLRAIVAATPALEPHAEGSAIGFHTERAVGAEYVSSHPVDLRATL